MGLAVSAAAAAAASMPKSLILSMFDAPCEAGRLARSALLSNRHASPKLARAEGNAPARAATLGILPGLAYSQVRPLWIGQLPRYVQ
jgi:hypothetical protein